MKYGICPLSIVPMRSEADDRSEMTSQVLFGEYFKVTDIRSKWSRIRLAHDNYEGWISNKQWQEISKDDYERLYRASPVFFGNRFFIARPCADPNEGLTLTLGVVLPDYRGGIFEGDGMFSLAGKDFACAGTVLSGKKDRKFIKEMARHYLHAPYLWGGRTIFGTDCSGFSQMVYRLAGFALPRDAREQAKKGEPLSFVEEAEVGDLAFFDNENGDIVHVGIVLEDYNIIHGSGCVRIDKLDQTGIFNVDTGKYTHKLRVIKKIIP